MLRNSFHVLFYILCFNGFVSESIQKYSKYVLLGFQNAVKFGIFLIALIVRFGEFRIYSYICRKLHNDINLSMIELELNYSQHMELS